MPAAVPDLATPELGLPGLRQWGGYVFEEFRPELQGLRGARVFREMRDNDAIVGAMLYAFEQLMGQVSWRVEPASQDVADKATAAFVQECLDDMATPWRETVGEILSMLWAGWAFHEVTFKRREGDVVDPTRASRFSDRAIGWRDWSPRSQETLERWLIDEETGVTQGLEQRPPPRYDLRPIPLERGLLFRTKVDRRSPEGRSILRNAWRSYLFVKRLQDILGIGVERDLAGLPVLTPPEGVDIWNRKDAGAVAKLAEAEKIVRNIRLDQHMGIVKPFGWNLELLSTQGRKQYNITEVIQYFDQRMAMSVLADFILIGHEAQSRSSMALSKTMLFTMAAGSYLDRVCDVVNRHAIPRLLALNGKPTERVPELKRGDLDVPDLSEMGQYITALAGAGMPLFPDAALERELRQIARLPEPPEPVEGGPPGPGHATDPASVQVALQELAAEMAAMRGQGSMVDYLQGEIKRLTDGKGDLPAAVTTRAPAAAAHP